jgi:hypothetical protein
MDRPDGSDRPMMSSDRPSLILSHFSFLSAQALLLYGSILRAGFDWYSWAIVAFILAVVVHLVYRLGTPRHETDQHRTPNNWYLTRTTSPQEPQ